MKERPILFSAPMVRAILDGRKTQTRRIVKSHPTRQLYHLERLPSGEWRDEEVSLGVCPYGQPGDRLWVKETWYTDAPDEYRPTELSEAWNTVEYVADDGPDVVRCRKLRPSIFMRRWMSRITLEITAVRVERLQDISSDDARAEGIEVAKFASDPGVQAYRDYAQKYYDPFEWYSSAVDSYRSLWESINGDGSWSANPFVWVLEFKRV
jgi:hypothetical protein